MTTTNHRSCIDCATPGADLPMVCETGTFLGWICRDCDRTRRHKRAGWRGRIRKRLGRTFG